MNRLVLLMSLVVVLWVAPEARAQLQFDISPNTQNLLPGSMASFLATLMNNGTGDIFLNGDSSEVFGAGLSLDDTKYLLDAPLSLAPGESWSGGIFDLTASTQTQAGMYSGTFSILGGADPSSFNVLASQDFFAVVPVVASAPEPPAVTLELCAGMVVLLARDVMIRWRRRRGVFAHARLVRRRFTRQFLPC